MTRESTFSETIATVLRTHQYSQTSCVVTWLTPDRGRISTVAKGSYRPKSSFLGQHDLFYTCELVYYDKERNGLHVSREFAPLKPRPEIRKRWRAAVLASHIACLLCETPQHDPHSLDLHALAETTFDYLNENEPGIQMLPWFELHFLGALGLAPSLTRCSGCGTELRQDRPAAVSVSDGGLRCHECTASARRHSSGAPSQIQPDSLAVLRNWQACTSPRLAANTRCSALQLTEISSLLQSFLEFHVAFRHESRNIALKLLKSKKKEHIT